VTVRSGADCHELRRELQQVLRERFDLRHTTLQVDHEAAPQTPIQIRLAEPHRK
jgi:cobalt-zinc-cadmium efflux system protein